MTQKSGQAERFVRLRAALIAWFKKAHRPMPWRQTRDPYKVWVSEIMLQQTRVDAVVPFYNRWMARFPTVSALAEAPLDEVLAHWSGLGYYARARNLHSAASDVVARYGGRVPDEPAEIRTLAGIGPYTAGAILSIAYGRAEPILDGNVTRVLSRLFVIDGPAGATETTARLWQLAAALVPADAASDFNQSMMELGATVCTPRNPDCAHCPVHDECDALAQGCVDELPRPKKKAAVPTVAMVTLLARREQRVWLAQRPTRGLWGGLWEPPSGERIDDETDEQAANRLARSWALDVTWRRLPPIVHLLSHRRLEIAPFVVGLGRTAKPKLVAPYTDARWVALAALSQVGLSAWASRLIASVPA